MRHSYQSTQTAGGCRLNPNVTIRNAASTRAAQLSDVLLQISKNSTFKHFDTAYVPFPLAQIAQEWEKRGGKAADLIEPVDGAYSTPAQLSRLSGVSHTVGWCVSGFHPSQIGHYLIVRCVHAKCVARSEWLKLCRNCF